MPAYVFRIHEATQPGQTSPTAAANVHGWDRTAHISGAFLNNIQVGTVNNRMGTSIPSLFARLYLFEGAFQALRDSPIAALNDSTSNTALISECFDLLEFLYLRGNDRNLIIKLWDAQQQIQLLEGDGNQKHMKLARVIRDEINLHPEFRKLYLFYWRTTVNATNIQQQEILIGGTSPLTLVFTSPNWKRLMGIKGLNFKRLDGNPMFDTNIESLAARNEQFKKMVYSCFMAYQQPLQQMCPSFERYIQTCWANEDMKDPDIEAFGGDPAKFSGHYPSLRDENDANVYIGKIPLSYEQVRPGVPGSGSDYQIRSTSNRYATYNYQGNVVHIASAPLVLNENGINGALYIGGAQWDPQTCQINDAATRNVPLHERHLPGQMGIQAPFVIWSDFLEDRIIKTSYAIDDSHFVTATPNDRYLLPLKKEFFNFFEIADLTRVVGTLGGRDLHLLEIEQDNNSVKVTLNIPINYHNSTIPLTRVYQGDSIVDGQGFIVGCFPFYRVMDNNNLNRYAVLNCGSNSALSFYNVPSVDNPVRCDSQVRTQGQQMIQQTAYYDVCDSFDFIKVAISQQRQGQVRTTNGLIIPIFEQITVGIGTRHFSFAVDFGTSNTYIAYNTDINPIPLTFEYGGNDAQCVYLNKDKVGVDLQPMTEFFNREFAPFEIGQNRRFALPTRTATCETDAFAQGTPSLFGNISVGFNFMNEVVIGQASFAYKTDLKWALESNPADVNAQHRVESYFLQILWMLKNKALQNGGSNAFDLYITFPESMKAPTKNMFRGYWRSAITNLGLNGSVVLHADSTESESIAPYNKLAPTIGGANLLNVDIGGGTSDMLFVNKVNGMVSSAYYCSTKFAADDLWGDGLNVGINLGPTNGFLNYVKGVIDGNKNNYNPVVTSKLDAILNLTQSSADAMGFLFKNENVFGTSNLIAQQQYLYSLVFVHYAALMYYIARVIKKLKIDIPDNISFTGMGSRYIHLISANVNDILGLTRLLLEEYTGRKAPMNLRVFMEPEPKEVTAKGVLVGTHLMPPYQIPANQLQKCVDYGFDTNASLTYGNVGDQNVKDAVLAENSKFLNTLLKPVIANYIYQNFGLAIQQTLLNNLAYYCAQSYNDMCTTIPKAYNNLNVEETLFFWPLKLALPQVSQQYNQPQVPQQ